MLESSAPSIPVSDYQFDLGFTFPPNFQMHRALGLDSHFYNHPVQEGVAGSILDLISRTAKQQNGNDSRVRKEILTWLIDVSWYAPGIIFSAGPCLRHEDSIHIIAISPSQKLMKRVQEKVPKKPKGVWAFYTTVGDLSPKSGSDSPISIPLWIRAILAGEHMFVTTDGEIYQAIKKLRFESIGIVKDAPIDFLSELAFFDVYRKTAKRMPGLNGHPETFIRLNLCELRMSKEEVLQECNNALKQRNVKDESRMRTLFQIAAYFKLSKEDISKYTGVVDLVKRKRSTQTSLPVGRIGQGKQIV